MPETTVSLEPNEIELFFSSARCNLAPSTAERVRELARSGIDWERFFAVADRNRVSLLLYNSLNSACPGDVPGEVLTKLSELYSSNVERNQFLAENLISLLDLFASHGIRALPFKGPLLAQLTYGDIGLRQCWDLDLLVHPRDFRKASAIFLDAGFKLVGFYDYEQTFLRGEVKVDLHKGLAPKFLAAAISFDTLWDGAVQESFAGSRVRNLRSDHLLDSLSVQIGKEYWEGRSRLAKICDLAELVRAHPEVDIERIVEESANGGSVSLALSLISRLLNAELPEKVEAGVASDPKNRIATEQIRQRVIARPWRSDIDRRVFVGGSKDKARYYYYRTIYATQYWARKAFAPGAKDRAFVKLPRSLEPLYYAIRPFRVARDAIAASLRGRRDPGRGDTE